MFFPQQMDECIGRAAEYLPCTSTDAKIQQNDETAMVDVKAQIVFLEREK